MSPGEMWVLLLILGSLAADCALGDPCVTHTVLDQPWRSTDCSGTECTGRWMDDRDLVVGWYRFNSSGGRKIPETVVPVNHCSGGRPGWLNGAHPSVGEGEVTRTICFTGYSSTCYWNREIRVKNCSGYFVYKLKPSPRVLFIFPIYTVYCTAADSALGDPCVTHTVLDQPWRSTDCSDTEYTGRWMDDGDLVVGWFRFNSSGGRKIPETVVPVNHCSGKSPGWLNGSHPSVGEGEVTRTICFTWDGNTCYWKQTIRVKNCSSYFVYQLKPSPGKYPALSPTIYTVYCTAPENSTREEAKGSPAEDPTQEPSSVPSGDTSSVRQTSGGEGHTGSSTRESPQGPPSATGGETPSDPENSTREEAKGSPAGDPTQEPSSVPSGDTSSDRQTSGGEGHTGSSTRESPQGPPSAPVGEAPSDPENSTREQATGSATGDPTREPSSVPSGDTSSDRQTSGGEGNAGSSTRESPEVLPSAPGEETLR